MSVRGVFAAAVIALTGVRELAAQGIEKHLPAFGELHDSVSAGAGKTIIITGVPGERSLIRLDPKPPHLPGAWQLTLMQAGEPTRTWVGGPHQTLRTDEVQFGDDGAVAVIVRTPGATGGSYVLRASSRLPEGFKHPLVVSLPAQGSFASLAPGTHFDVASWMRSGLELRVTLHFPTGPGIVVGQDPECSPGVVLTPLPLAGEASFHALPVPAFPSPKTWVQVVATSTFAHADYSAEAACGIEAATARIRRHHVAQGKPIHIPGYVGPPFISYWNIQADVLEVQPGGQVRLSGLIVKPDCGAPVVSRTLRAWLNSPHAPIFAPTAGLDLTGPVSLTFTQQLMPFEMDVTVPPDVEPGLYALQLVIGTPGIFDPCADSQLKPPAALPLRVLEP